MCTGTWLVCVAHSAVPCSLRGVCTIDSSSHPASWPFCLGAVELSSDLHNRVQSVIELGSKVVGAPARSCATACGSSLQATELNGDSSADATGSAGFHVSLAHTQPSQRSQRKSLLQGMQQALRNAQLPALDLRRLQVCALLALALCCSHLRSLLVDTALSCPDRMLAIRWRTHCQKFAGLQNGNLIVSHTRCALYALAYERAQSESHVQTHFPALQCRCS